MKLHTKIKENGIVDFTFNQRMYLQKNVGKYLVCEIPKIKRTNNQNRFYWFYLGIISSETGDDSNSLHEYFRRTFLPPKFITVMGKEIKIPTSTTELSKIEFGEYMDRISADTEIEIPNPCENGFFCGKASCMVCNSK